MAQYSMATDSGWPGSAPGPLGYGYSENRISHIEWIWLFGGLGLAGVMRLSNEISFLPPGLIPDGVIGSEIHWDWLLSVGLDTHCADRGGPPLDSRGLGGETIFELPAIMNQSRTKQNTISAETVLDCFDYQSDRNCTARTVQPQT